ncbi:MAG: N-acetyltransferase, partial [Pseudonocardiales bacterium]|nr:N-acetyltransferase [Pseudonocardiales bacterium]
MADKPCVPRKLTKADVREGFDSGAPELDEWFIRYSWQNQRANNAVTYVTVLDGRVVGYYAIAVANITSESAPAPVAKNAPKHVPCLLLARLAADRSMQGCGLGRGPLIDALKRTVG